MSIQTAIQNAQQKVANAYTAVSEKGGTLPATQNLSNLPAAIGSISGGITPTGTLSITTNGTYDVTNYASANVNVEGGGGSATGYLVQVIDYDGTVLKSERLNTGDIFTMPNNPSHTGLTFQSWVSPITITNSEVTVEDYDITIGPTYTTNSGLSEFEIDLDESTGLSITFDVSGTKDWGDGTSDASTTHEYAYYGTYTITTNATSIPDNRSKSIQGDTKDCLYLRNIRISSNVTELKPYAFYNCKNLKTASLPDNIRLGYINSSDYTFYNCYSLKSITCPNTTSLYDSFENCFSLESVALPSTLRGISDFNCCYNLRSISIPNVSGMLGIGVDGIGPFDKCYSLESITIPEGVNTLSNCVCQSAVSLKRIKLPSTLNYTYANCFTECPVEHIEIPNTSNISLSTDSVHSGYSPDGVDFASFSSVYVKSIKLNSASATLGEVFVNNVRCMEYDFTAATSVYTLNSTKAFKSINNDCKIKVPWNLYQDWIIATNWAILAKYIYGGAQATVNFSITPSMSQLFVNKKYQIDTSVSWTGPSMPYIVYNSTNNVVLSNTQTGITEGATVNITANLTSYNKITLSTNITGLSPIFTIGGMSFNATDEGNGNYSINVVGSGINVGYNIDGGGIYRPVEGQITTTGSNITENITMQELTWQTFTRPNLTADGTLGGDSFAVGSNASVSSYYGAWRAVDGSTSTSYYWWASSSDITYTFYNPNLLKVSQITFTYTNTNYRATTVTIQGSNDNSNWTDISSSYSGTTTGTLTVTNDIGYKYHRLVFTKYGSYIYLVEMGITAQEGV